MTPTPRPPEARPRSTDPHRPAGVAATPDLGAWLDQSGSLRARGAEVGGRVTEQMDRLFAETLVERVMAEQPRPGWVVRAWRRVFGRGRPATPKIRRPEPTPTRSGELAPTPTWMRWLGVWLDRTVGSLPLLAPLVVSGWYTAHVGTDALGLAWPIAIALTIALEGGVWRLGRLYENTLVAGDSTIALRLGLLAYVAAIGGLIFWHATATAGDVAHADWRPAAVVSSMSLAGIYIWSRRARWQRREELRAAGRVDAQLVRFSVWSWLVAPLETAAALRYAVKHRIDKPIPAMEAYRADRKQHRDAAAEAKVARAKKKADAKAEAKAKESGKKKPTGDPQPQPTPAPKPTRRRADRPTPTGSDPTPTADPAPADPSTPNGPTPTRSTPTRPTKPKPTRSPVAAIDDEPILADLRRLYPTRSPSNREVEAVAKCSRSRAIRLKNLYAAELAKQPA